MGPIENVAVPQPATQGTGDQKCTRAARILGNRCQFDAILRNVETRT